MLDRFAVVVATTNSGKRRELVELLSGLPLDIQSLADLPPAPAVEEDGDTYLANALKKAIAIARWSGRATLADDSGLEVDALDGKPGIHSARYAGRVQDSSANLAKLLHALAGVPESRRTARFRCALVVAAPDGATLTAEDSCEGQIIEAPRGRAGFGYDPIFLYPAARQTFAELPAVVKNRISHRARACAQLRPLLLEFLARHARVSDDHSR